MLRYVTSESVTEGHPDKICDQISDAILDDILRQDPNAKCACDVAVNTGLVLVMGEITCEGYVEIPRIARQVIEDIGYTESELGFDANSCGLITSVDEQSKDIADGVKASAEYRANGDIRDLTGAGDQGMMYGFACRETKELMPMPITLAHALTSRLAGVRKNGVLNYLRPDGKAQVTVAYENGKPKFVGTIVLAAQHSPDVSTERIVKDLYEHVVKAAIPADMLTKETKVYINATGRFVTGGPRGDSGLTGRKIIVDTYGGYIPHGGGAFSGKDPTKVDRSAAYMTRYICKNIVAAGLADKCQMEVAYAIGRARPVAVYVDSFGTGKVSDEKLINAVNTVFDLRPGGIIEALDLRKPIYRKTCNYGHFGRPGFTWENTDRVDALLKAVKAQ